MFERTGNEILKIEEVETKNQKVLVKYHFGMAERVVLDISKTQLTVGEEVIIALKWQKFDIEQEQYVDDQINTTPFKVDVAGVVDNINSIDGVATIQLSSAAAGEFEIKTVNPNVDNTSVKVVVQDATG